VSNLVYQGQLKVTSPAAYDYFIIDLNGRAVTKGKISTGINNINLPGVVNGMYMIRYVSGAEQWIEKFILK
jgi:hypothetical protein